MSGGKILEQIEIDLSGQHDRITIYVDIWDNSLSRKWLVALNDLLAGDYHLEKNFSWLGFASGPRDGDFILDQINTCIRAINRARIGYHIDDSFDMANTTHDGPVAHGSLGLKLRHERMNALHRYFEDLQGTSTRPSEYYLRADPTTKWHIRQLNLLCHEFECWILSRRHQLISPEWQRPSTLFCWLNAPRFSLDPEDFELFGIDTINRSTGGVFVGVNKAVGKHHWEVFNDEGRDSRIAELCTTVLSTQSEWAGDFDIEWAVNPADRPWQIDQLTQFRYWLQANGFDPEDKSLTIGHPQIGQVDLRRSFGTADHFEIWNCLAKYLNVDSIKTSTASNQYHYSWNDADFMQRQVSIIQRNQSCVG